MKEKIIIFICMAIILTAGSSWAITLNVSPNPAIVGQNVHISATASFVATPGQLNINFGDGTPVYVQDCTITPCTASTAHIYTTTGTFTVTASAAGATAPNPVSILLFVQCSPLTITSPAALPSGTVGQGYSYQIQTAGGQLPVTFSLVSGSLPPGLSLSPTGLISGISSSAGDYTFTVKAMDSCASGIQSAEKSHTIRILSTPVSVNVTPVPSSFRIARGQSSANSVGYRFTGTPTLNVALTSSEGIFMAGNERIGAVPIPLTVNIQNGSGFVSDAVNIPVAIIERAIQSNANTFTFTRTFSNSQTSVTATVFFTITTEAGADFELKRIELYFDNRRPEITVERNFSKLRAYAAIRFIGSGLLQGYWEVDGRLISTVNQHLVYAKDVLLETPEIPPLPTFDPGSHIVRFVITSPATAIPLPSIVYYVTPGEAKPIPVKINLISPLYEASLEYIPASFNWAPLDGTAVYLVQYFEKPYTGTGPIFSAYTRGSSYSLPQTVFDDVFSPGQKYYWKVTGFKDEKNIRGESEIRPFTFQENSKESY